jgi:hypothetical protein
VDNNKFDINLILKRVKEIALEDDFKSLRPIITIEFNKGNSKTAPWEPFIVKEIQIGPLEPWYTKYLERWFPSVE